MPLCLENLHSMKRKEKSIYDNRTLLTKSLRLRLDVDIGRLGIELGSMPKQSSIGNGLQYQIHCLDVDKIIRWNPER